MQNWHYQNRSRVRPVTFDVLKSVFCIRYAFILVYEWRSVWSLWAILTFVNAFVTRVAWRVPLMEQELVTLPEHMSSPLVYSGVHVARYLVFFCVVFCCSFSFHHRVVCSSSIYIFWLLVWYLQAPLIMPGVNQVCWYDDNVSFIQDQQSGLAFFTVLAISNYNNPETDILFHSDTLSGHRTNQFLAFKVFGLTRWDSKRRFNALEASTLTITPRRCFMYYVYIPLKSEDQV
jgi:hypothetical protein